MGVKCIWKANTRELIPNEVKTVKVRCCQLAEFHHHKSVDVGTVFVA